MAHQQRPTMGQNTKTMSTVPNPSGNFRGFRSPNYTMVPDELFDEVMADLSGAELKVLLYIIRRTYGFKKQRDDISLNQICHGITTRGGQVLDHGTGLSRSTVKVALHTLLARNIIIADHRESSQHGYEATTYQLNIAAPEGKPGQDPPGPIIGLAPWAGNKPSPGPETSLALGRKSALQETVEKQTVFDVDSMGQPPKRISHTTRRRSSSPAGVQRIAGEQEATESVSALIISSAQCPSEPAQAVGSPGAANDQAGITREPVNQRRSPNAGALPEPPIPSALIEAIRALLY